eukprot:scaffold11295_cov120-Isochrysis_galbana.AAC.4
MLSGAPVSGIGLGDQEGLAPVIGIGLGDQEGLAPVSGIGLGDQEGLAPRNPPKHVWLGEGRRRWRCDAGDGFGASGSRRECDRGTASVAVMVLDASARVRPGGGTTAWLRGLLLHRRRA